MAVFTCLPTSGIGTRVWEAGGARRGGAGRGEAGLGVGPRRHRRQQQRQLVFTRGSGERSKLQVFTTAPLRPKSVSQIKHVFLPRVMRRDTTE